MHVFLFQFVNIYNLYLHTQKTNKQIFNNDQTQYQNMLIDNKKPAVRMQWRLTVKHRWSHLLLRYQTAQSHHNCRRIHHHYVQVKFCNHYQCLQVWNESESNNFNFILLHEPIGTCRSLWKKCSDIISSFLVVFCCVLCLNAILDLSV